MERVLEGNLLIGTRSLIFRHRHLHGLEVEEIKRIGELLQELTNLLRRHQFSVVQIGSYLQLLYLAELFTQQVLKADFALIVQLALLLEAHAIEVEHVGRSHSLGAISKEATGIGGVTVYVDRLARLIATQCLLCLCNVDGYFHVFIGDQFVHILNVEQLLDVEFLSTYIELVESNQIATVHLHATLCEHPLLVGNIAGVDQ